jgi:hypothetical protein
MSIFNKGSRMMLQEGIKLFGFWGGFGMWWRWHITDTIKIFYWQHITHKPYCAWAGWFCHDKDCKHRHLQYPKEPKIKKGDLCTYCNKETPKMVIHNPNDWDYPDMKDYFWKVCDKCWKVIDLQEQQSFRTGILTAEWMSEDGKDKVEEDYKRDNEKLKEMGAVTFELRKMEDGNYEGKKII